MAPVSAAKILGIDVGGSGIKGAVVDVGKASLVSDRQRIATPQPSTPDNIARVVAELVERLDSRGPVGCSFPAVIVDGAARTAGNLDPSWRGVHVDRLFAEQTGRSFTIINDADAAGIAEMEFGAGKGLQGLVIMVTIGTGLGTGVFYNGQLVPNIELGRMPGKDGEPIEFYAGDRARKDGDLDWQEWGRRFNYFLERVVRVLSPDHFILGGGASKKLGKFGDQIRVDTPIHLARFRNNAGIIGAALAAARCCRDLTST